MDSSEHNAIENEKPDRTISERDTSNATACFATALVGPIVLGVISAPHVVYIVGLTAFFGLVLVGRRLNPKSLDGLFVFALYVLGILFATGSNLWERFVGA
jgi:hypothetical protein